MPRRLEQQRPFHASRAMSAVTELLVLKRYSQKSSVDRDLAVVG